MKIVFSLLTIALFLCTTPLWAQTASDQWSLFGRELGSYDNTKDTTVNKKGEIIWTNSDDEWEEFGWDLCGIDLSAYEGIRVVLQDNSPEIPINSMKISNGFSPGHMIFKEVAKGIYELYFDGRGKEFTWGNAGKIEPEWGLTIFFCVPGKKDNLKTRIKSVQLIQKGSSQIDYRISPFNIALGTTNLRSIASGNTIYWSPGYNDARCGWDFSGIDLSAYDRVRIETEENDANMDLILCGKELNNWHCYNRIAPSLYEAPLSGENAIWISDDAHPFNLKQGLMVILQKQDEEIRKEMVQTHIKSIRFLRPGEDIYDGGVLGLAGRAMGSLQDYTILDDHTITWQAGNTDLKCGWNLIGIDLTRYKGIRIEIERTDIRFEISMTDPDFQNWKTYPGASHGVVEAYFSGEGASWMWDGEDSYDLERGIHLFLRYSSPKPLKKERETVITRVELIPAD